MSDWDMFNEIPEGDFTPPPQPEKPLEKPKKKPFYRKKKPPMKKPKDPDKRLIYAAQEAAKENVPEDREKRTYPKERVFYGDDEEARQRAIKDRILKYRKEKTYFVQIGFNRSVDGNIIEWLESKPNKSEYIRGLILSDMLIQ